MSKLVYLDNAATTFPKPDVVYTAADDFYRATGANAGRGQNPLAMEAAALIYKVRSQVARLLGVASPEQVIFSPSATIALNQVIFGTRLTGHDVVYVTPFEHNSVLRPVEHLRRTLHLEVKVLPVDPVRLEVPLDRIEAQFQARPPALLLMTQVSNVCGLLLPVTEIARLARAANPTAVIIVDGAQGAGMYPLPLTSGLIDYFVFSGHKTLYGPYGAAGFILASHHRAMPFLFGGTGTDSDSVSMPETIPTAYEPGSMNTWALAGLGAAVDWIDRVGQRAILEHTHALLDKLVDELSRCPGIKLHLPPPESRTPIVSFTCTGASPQTVEGLLGASAIAVRAGLHCAPWCHQLLGTLGTGGTIRVSPGYFNSTSDIEALISAVRPALAA